MALLHVVNSQAWLSWKVLIAFPLCALQLGDSLEEFLVDATSDQNLRQVMMSLSEAIRTIAFKVKPQVFCWNTLVALIYS